MFMYLYEEKNCCNNLISFIACLNLNYYQSNRLMFGMLSSVVASTNLLMFSQYVQVGLNVIIVFLSICIISSNINVYNMCLSAYTIMSLFIPIHPYLSCVINFLLWLFRMVVYVYLYIRPVFKPDRFALFMF